jgi:UDP:flavonoid glycosyltransferase YjiC (YdhE family)
MRIVFASLPAYGHLYPMPPLALSCVERGHEVTVAAGEPFLSGLPVPAVPGIAADVSLHDVEQETFRDHPGLEPGLEWVAYLFGETTVRHTAPVLRDLFALARPDLVVHEVMNVGAAVAAAAAGVRAMAFGLGLWNPLLSSLYAVADAAMGPYVDPVPPSLQEPGPLPAARVPIRSAAWGPPVPLPPWLGARRTVYVTLGTVSFGAVAVLRRAALATAAHDVDVLVAVGPEGDPALLGELPPNVHVERFVSQAAVLREVDAVVHHGGAGTVLGALAAGLPQLILPQGADHPVNAAAITRTGAGLALTDDEQTPGAIEAAVGDLLTTDRPAVRRLAAEIAAMPSPAEVAAQL